MAAPLCLQLRAQGIPLKAALTAFKQFVEEAVKKQGPGAPTACIVSHNNKLSVI